jgi:hypothetical protein
VLFSALLYCSPTVLHFSPLSPLLFSTVLCCSLRFFRLEFLGAATTSRNEAERTILHISQLKSYVLPGKRTCWGCLLDVCCLRCHTWQCWFGVGFLWLTMFWCSSSILLSGDIILFKCSDTWNSITRLTLSARFDHVAIVVQNTHGMLKLLESTWNGFTTIHVFALLHITF